MRILRPSALLISYSLIVYSCADQSTTPPAEPPAAAEPAAPAESGPVVVGRAFVGSGGAQTVIVLEPREPREFPPPPEMPVMDQAQREFIPSFLVVRSGHPAEFLNNDPELHNLNVKEAVSREQVFNVAIPQSGRYRHTLQKPGLYDVSCDIHPTMSAVILAASGPYVAYADGAGMFSMTGVPPGAYSARAFGGGQAAERQVEVSAGRTEINFVTP